MVFTKEPINITEARKIFNRDLEEQLRNWILNDDIILKKLLNLNPDRFAGMNAISPKVLKVAHEIAKPLLSIFRKNLNTGVLPAD